MRKYFYHDGKKQHGPYTLYEIKNLRLSRKFHFWYKELSEWKLGHEITELEDYLIGTKKVFLKGNKKAFNKPIPKGSNDTLKKILSRLNKTYIKIGVALGFITGIISLKECYYKTTISKGDEHIEKTQTEDVIPPFQGSNQSPDLMVIHGYEQGVSNGEIEAIPFNDLRQGTNLFRNFIACESEDPVKLMVKLDGEKLKFSLGFKDIKTGEVVGFRKRDEVNLVDRNYLDLHSTKDSLQVLDNSGYVILQLKYEYPNKLFLNGYFVGDKGVVVYWHGVHCTSKKVPDWKEASLEVIQLIKPWK